MITTTGSSNAWLSQTALQGTISWDAGDGDQVQIPVPVRWQDVPYQAEYRLALELDNGWNAEVGVSKNETALHLFGVRPGQCPPGTFR